MVRSVASAAIAFIALGAQAGPGCHWEASKTGTVGKTDPNTRELHCTPKAFHAGCVKIFNDTCNSSTGCSPITFTTTVIGGTGLVQNSFSTNHTHILKAGAAKGQKGQELAIAYGQYIRVRSCLGNTKSSDCYTVLSRSYDQDSGGTDAPCKNNCRDGNCK
jgi:hypothetical protein